MASRITSLEDHRRAKAQRELEAAERKSIRSMLSYAVEDAKRQGMSFTEFVREIERMWREPLE